MQETFNVGFSISKWFNFRKRKLILKNYKMKLPVK